MYAETADIAIDYVIDGAVKDGGATASIRGNGVPTSGYMVGGLAAPFIIDADETSEQKRGVLWQMIFRYVNQNFSVLKNENVFLGSWIDQSTNTLYIDVSEYVESKSDAYRLGLSRKEIAIWDIANSAEITL